VVSSISQDLQYDAALLRHLQPSGYAFHFQFIHPFRLAD
jgi:hypothetical protein